jgi:hypothetical protein
MKRLVLLTAAAALVAPGVAAAKELRQVQLCGPAACSTITDSQTLRQIPTGGEAIGNPPAASSFYTMKLTVDADGHEDAWTVFYVPAANAIAAPDELGTIEWFSIHGAAATGLMRRLVADLEPYPKPEITRATVDGRAVASDPGSYLELFAVEPAGEAVPNEADWVFIRLQSRQPSPWTSTASSFAYSPSAKLLERGTEFIRVPDDIAADIERAGPLGTDGRSLLPWLVVGGLLAALLGLAGLGALGRRRWQLPGAPVRRPTTAS